MREPPTKAALSFGDPAGIRTPDAPEDGASRAADHVPIGSRPAGGTAEG